MLKRLILAAAALSLSAAVAFAQIAFPTGDGKTAAIGGVGMCVNPGGVAGPCGGTPETAASGNKAAASATATLAAATGKTTYITGFQISAGGATSAVCVSPTVTGVITGTMTFTFCAPAGVTTAATPLIVTFPQPVPASATNTTIVVTLPSLGTGNTNATVSAQGFQF